MSCGSGSMCSSFRRGNTMSIRPPRGCLAPTGWNSPDPHVYPTGAELLERYIEPLATKTRFEGRHPHLQPRHGRQPVGFDKAKTQGPRERAVRDPLSEWQGAGDSARRRRHRRFRHLAVAEPGGRQWASGHRRARGASADFLRHAGCSWKGPRTLCRQDRRRAWGRALCHRHADRPDDTCSAGAGHRA